MCTVHTTTSQQIVRVMHIYENKILFLYCNEISKTCFGFDNKKTAWHLLYYWVCELGSFFSSKKVQKNRNFSKGTTAKSTQEVVDMWNVRILRTQFTRFLYRMSRVFGRALDGREALENKNQPLYDNALVILSNTMIKMVKRK